MTNKFELTINGNTIFLSPTGVDDVPVYSVSDMIQEEKLSFQLWGEFYSGNLEKYTQRPGEFFDCNISLSNQRTFRNFAIMKESGSIEISEDFRFGGHWNPLTYYDELKRYSLYALLQKTTPYKGLLSTSFYFHEDSLGYSSFVLSNYHFHLSKFREKVNQETQDCDLYQWKMFQHFYVHRFPNRFDFISQEVDSDFSSDQITMCFNFTNCIGETVMKIIKLYLFQNGHLSRKCYLPLTSWYSKDIHRPIIVSVGLPDKQPLFNLHQIAAAEIVIICLSLEIAVFQQKYAAIASSIVFTAFVCDDDQYSQVDFTPLRGKSVKILISNESGRTLAERYMTAKSLSEYLHENVKIEQIEFIQMAVSYPSIENVLTVHELVSVHRNQPPKIIDDSVKLMTESAFEQMLPRAEAEIERKKCQAQDMPFWKEENVVIRHQSENDSPMQTMLDKMILRPFIVGGFTTVIESSPGMGKSCFTTALCAQIVGSNAPFLEERCITRCSPKTENGYKVVYLTFDADGVAIDEHRKDFAGDLGEQDINFIQRDMSGDETNYSKPENYGIFISLLKSIRNNEGNPGQDIDVLVIDTLLEFTHNSVANSNLLFRELVKEFPNMAILLIHHLNKANETYGGIKSSMAPRAILKLYRTDEQLKNVQGRNPTLADPFTVSVEKFNVNKIPEDGESFALKLDKNNHFVVDGGTRSKEKMRESLISQYEEKYNADQKLIARLFGTTDRTIRNWIKSEK